MKKYLNFVGLGIEPTGQFLHRIRRVTTRADFFAVCEEFLNHDQLMPLEPFTLALKETDVMSGEHG
jgi:tRNA-dihydrouridine synthase B